MDEPRNSLDRVLARVEAELCTCRAWAMCLMCDVHTEMMTLRHSDQACRKARKISKGIDKALQKPHT